MTSSKTFKRLLTLGASSILVLGGSFVTVDAASATTLNTAPVVNISGNLIASDGNIQQTSYASFSGVPNNYGGGGGTVTNWRICDTSPTVTSSFDGLDMPASWNCQDVYTSFGLFNGTSLTLSGVTALGTSGNTVPNSALVGKYVVRFEMSKNMQDNTIYGWAISPPKLIVTAPTMTGTNTSLSGTLGSALTMPAYTTTGLTSPVVFSYTTFGNASLPAGVTFDTTTGQLTGTPTASISGLMVTVTATGNNGLTKSSSFSFTVTSGSSGGSGGGNSYSPCNPTVTLTSIGWSSSSIDTSGTVRTIYNNDPSIGSSTTCMANPMDVSILSTLNGVVIGNPSRYSTYTLLISSATRTLSTILLGSNFAGVTVHDGDVYVTNYYVSLGRVPTLSDTPTFRSSLILNTGVGGGSVSAPNVTPLSAEQAKNQIKPLPVIVQPLVAALPQLSKPMFNQGGKLSLTAGDFSGLVSASISGKPIDLTVATNGGLTITVPNGEAGKTADLFLKFTTGTVIIQDAIKYVAPVVVADVPTRPVSIVAGSTKLSQETADQVRQAAFANMKNTTISCVAYAANGSAAARAAAVATAEQVCALAVKSNPALTATPVTVVVDKAKAKTSGVGIKVYQPSN